MLSQVRLRVFWRREQLPFHSPESDFLFAFPLETWGCRILLILSGNFLLLFNCVYPFRFPLLQPGREQRRVPPNREAGAGDLTDSVGSATANRDK